MSIDFAAMSSRRLANEFTNFAAQTKIAANAETISY